MGLEMSHGCYLGPYSSFTRLRNEIAYAAGYPLHVERTLIDGKMAIFNANYELGEGNITPEQELGEWNEVPKDPLVILLAHSNHKGLLKATHCTLIADRLEALLPKFGGGIEDPHTDAAAVRRMIDGLREAAAAGEDVEFC